MMLTANERFHKNLKKAMLLIACLLTLIHPGNYTRVIPVYEVHLAETLEEDRCETFDVSSEEREEIGAAQVFKRLLSIWSPPASFAHFYSSIIIFNFQRQTIARWWFSNGMTNAP